MIYKSFSNRWCYN